ncbi:MAG: hypothetical protein E6K70_18255 [Planctomycetota bacterium]|nr:MAG: hypothetical protein E6K70_18255 [Planctomycetota bacterium]
MKALGRQAEPFLRAELRRGPSPEVNFRVEQLLKELPPADQSILSGEQARALRMLETLERSGTPAARQLLETLVADAPDPSLRQGARAALERLAKRAAVAPESIHR